MFGNFFKPAPYNVFNYKPRYYDERKERIENLKKKYQNKPETSKDNEPINPEIKITKSHLKNEWVKHKKNESNWRSNLRLAIIITILFAVAAYFLDIHSLF